MFKIPVHLCNQKQKTNKQTTKQTKTNKAKRKTQKQNNKKQPLDDMTKGPSITVINSSFGVLS